MSQSTTQEAHEPERASAFVSTTFSPLAGARRIQLMMANNIRILLARLLPEAGYEVCPKIFDNLTERQKAPVLGLECSWQPPVYQ